MHLEKTQQHKLMLEKKNNLLKMIKKQKRLLQLSDGQYKYDQIDFSKIYRTKNPEKIQEKVATEIFQVKTKLASTMI